MKPGRAAALTHTHVPSLAVPDPPCPGATIHTVAGLWMSVAPRKDVPAAAGGAANGASVPLSFPSMPAAPAPVPVGAAAFDGSAGSTSSASGPSAAAPAGKCPFSGALGKLTGEPATQGGSAAAAM